MIRPCRGGRKTRQMTLSFKDKYLTPSVDVNDGLVKESMVSRESLLIPCGITRESLLIPCDITRESSLIPCDQKGIPSHPL